VGHINSGDVGMPCLSTMDIPSVPHSTLAYTKLHRFDLVRVARRLRPVPRTVNRTVHTDSLYYDQCPRAYVKGGSTIDLSSP
jgi:hypothetical protein